MWLKLEQTKEFIPVNEQMTEKVFWDGEKGWCVLQKNGKRYHLTQEQRDALDAEIDREVYWKRKELEDAAKGLSEMETKQVKALLKKLSKEVEKKEED